MTNQLKELERLKALMALAPEAKAKDIARLNNGPLKPLGDALIAGKKVTYMGQIAVCFGMSIESYTIVEEPPKLDHECAIGSEGVECHV